MYKSYFQLDPHYVHLALSMLTPHPLPVHQAIAKHREELDKNPVLYFRNKSTFEKEVLNQAAKYLNTSSGHIALTESTTMGLGLIYSGIILKKGDEILTTSHEHYSTLETLRYKAKRDGLVIKTIDLYQDSFQIDEETLVESLIKEVNEKTRLVALTWVHSCTGVKLPIAKITKRIAELNLNRSEEDQILVALDGLHGFGVEDFEVEKLGIDFFIAGCHKWLFGPRGTGIVWGKEEAWKKISPLMISFHEKVFFSWLKSKDIDAVCTKPAICTPGGFQAYEHRWALNVAFQFHLSIGKRVIQEKIFELNSYCKEQMLGIPKVKLHTPLTQDHSSGMVCFSVEKIDPGHLVEALLKERIISGQTPYRKSYCRFAPSLLNSKEEIDLALTALKKVILKGKG